MAGIASLGSVGAGLREAQFQTQIQRQALTDQLSTSEGLAAASLALIQVALSSAAQGYDLDVLA